MRTLILIISGLILITLTIIPTVIGFIGGVFYIGILFGTEKAMTAYDLFHHYAREGTKK